MQYPCFRYQAELTGTDGKSLGELPFVPDLTPAEESLRFQALRQGRSLPEAKVRATPIWDAKGPRVRGVRVALVGDGGEEAFSVFPVTYFRNDVRTAAAHAFGEAADDAATMTYTVSAFPIPTQPLPDSSDVWKVREVIESPIHGERSLAQYLVASVPVADPEDVDFPVFIPRSILRQAERMKDAAGASETGAILLARLWKDNESTEVFLEVTALIAAEHTVATSTSLRFVPETWEAVHSAILERGQGEVIAAWSHSHPARYWCQCSAEKQPSCPLGRQFFSTADCTVQRTAFFKAYHVALVTGDRPCAGGGWESVHALYGWRHGLVDARGFYLLDDAFAASVTNDPIAEAIPATV